MSHVLAKGALCVVPGQLYILANKARNKETNEQVHGRNIRLRWDSNQ